MVSCKAGVMAVVLLSGEERAAVLDDSSSTPIRRTGSANEVTRVRTPVDRAQPSFSTQYFIYWPVPPICTH